MPYNGYSEARKAANKKYMDKQARVVIWCSPEDKEHIEAAAEAAGESVNGFVKTAIRERIDRDTRRAA